MNERLMSEHIAELALNLEKSKHLAAELEAIEERGRELTIMIAANQRVQKPKFRPPGAMLN